ncbi:MAG: amidase [Candidatus Acidiferrales bacterium]
MDSPTRLSARAMAAAIREKKLSPVELVEAHLQRIEQLNPRLNAFVTLRGEKAREEARAAEATVARGQPLGPLHGVPVSIKSCIDVAGLPCEAGSKLRAGYVAAADAPLVARLRAAGAIILGNTNVPDMLMAYETDNLLYGKTRSPWDLERTPGGSSGGEAAAIAACCSAGGVGSDGGGSIRVPAHFSGICGLKPTPGRIPGTGHFPPNTGPFAFLGVVGPLARTVADLELLLEVMAGPDKGDTSSAPVPFSRASDDVCKRYNIGFFEDDARTPVTPETRAAVRAAAEALQRAGFQVSPFRPSVLEPARQAWWKLFVLGGAMVLGPLVAGREAELHPVLRAVMAIAAAEPPLTAETLMSAWMARDELRLQLLTEMERFPVLLCPACAVPAFKHGERRWQVDGQSVAYLDAMSYTQWFNLLGNPGAVVPVGRSPEGLPIGVQIVGRPFEEEIVLRVAAWVERECGGWQEPPLSRSLTT